MKTALFHSCGREQPQFQLGAGGNCISISWRNHPKTSRELLEHGQRPPEPRCFPLSALALPGHIQLPRSFLLCLDGHSIVPLTAWYKPWSLPLCLDGHSWYKTQGPAALGSVVEQPPPAAAPACPELEPPQLCETGLPKTPETGTEVRAKLSCCFLLHPPNKTDFLQQLPTVGKSPGLC